MKKLSVFRRVFVLIMALFTVPVMGQEALHAPLVRLDDGLAGCAFMGSNIEGYVRDALAVLGEPVAQFSPDYEQGGWYWIDESGTRQVEPITFQLRIVAGHPIDRDFIYADGGMDYAAGILVPSTQHPDVYFLWIYDHTANLDPDYPAGYHPCFSMAFRYDLPENPGTLAVAFAREDMAAYVEANPGPGDARMAAYPEYFAAPTPAPDGKEYLNCLNELPGWIIDSDGWCVLPDV